jgi:hypothetical protein
LTEQVRTPTPAEIEIAAEIERCKDKKYRDKFVKGKTVVLLVRLGYEMQLAHGKDFLELAKLWERVVLSKATRPPAKTGGKKDDEED